MSLAPGIPPRSDLRMPDPRGVWVVRTRVPLRDQPPADRFGDRLRAVDHSEFHADRSHKLIRAVLGIFATSPISQSSLPSDAHCKASRSRDEGIIGASGTFSCFKAIAPTVKSNL